MVQIDLVDDAELEALTNKIKVDWWNNFMEQEWELTIYSCWFFSSFLQIINGMAQMKKAKFGDVDMDFVLGIGGYDLDRLVVFIFFVTEKYWALILTFSIILASLIGIIEYRIEAEVQLQESKETGHCHHGDEHGKVHTSTSYVLHLWVYIFNQILWWRNDDK